MTDKEYVHIVQRARQNLLHIAMNYLGNAEDAEDAVQDVLLHLWMVRQRLIAGKEVNGLLSTMMRNHCVNVLRRQKTLEAFSRLPEEFTTEDVQRCFNLSSTGAARSRAKRLVDDHLAEKTGEVKDGSVYKTTYRKTGVMML